MVSVNASQVIDGTALPVRRRAPGIRITQAFYVLDSVARPETEPDLLLPTNVPIPTANLPKCQRHQRPTRHAIRSSVPAGMCSIWQAATNVSMKTTETSPVEVVIIQCRSSDQQMRSSTTTHHLSCKSLEQRSVSGERTWGIINRP